MSVDVLMLAGSLMAAFGAGVWKLARLIESLRAEVRAFRVEIDRVQHRVDRLAELAGIAE